MNSRRTVVAKDDNEFKTLADAIDAIMSAEGLLRRDHNGSASWLGSPSSTWCRATVVKLTYYGPGDIAFGLRKDFVKKTKQELAEIDWPYPFSVPPKTKVEFLGFKVRNDTASLNRIKRVLAGLNFHPQDDAERQKQFDEELDALGL